MRRPLDVPKPARVALAQLLANWRPDDFELRILGDTVVGSERSKAEVVAADKLVLQGYGRPYSEAGKPTGTYYKYSGAETLPSWAPSEGTSVE